MLASVLNSDRAIEINIQVVRTFIKLRNYVIAHSDTAKEIAELRKMLMLHIEHCDCKRTNSLIIRNRQFDYFGHPY